MRVHQSVAPQFYKAPSEAQDNFPADGAYAKKIFAALQKEWGGELTHYGFLGDRVYFQASCAASGFSGYVQEGCTRLILEGAAKTGQRILRVTWNRLEKLTDVRIPIPAPNLPGANIRASLQQEFYDREVLLWAAATAMEAVKTGGVVQPAGIEAVRELLAKIGAVSEENIAASAANVAVASVPVVTAIAPAADAVHIESHTRAELARTDTPFKESVFADDAKTAEMLKEGVTAYINPPRKPGQPAEYSVVFSGWTNLDELPPGPDADKCAHIAVSQRGPGKPIVMKIALIDKSWPDGGAVLTYPIPDAAGPAQQTALNGRLLSLAACIVKNMRLRKKLTSADCDRLLKVETRIATRRAIFGQERIAGIGNPELETALLAFKPLLNGVAQVNEAKEPARFFNMLIEVLNDDINEQDAARQKASGEQPFALRVIGFGDNGLQPGAGERTLCFAFGADEGTGYATVQIMGCPGISPRKEHMFVPLLGMAKQTMLSSLLFWAARLTIDGLNKTPPMTDADKYYAEVKSYRESIVRKPVWQALRVDEAQFLPHFLPVLKGPEYRARLDALAARPEFQTGFASVPVNSGVLRGAQAARRTRMMDRLVDEKIAPVNLPPSKKLSNPELFDVLQKLAEKKINEFVKDIHIRRGAANAAPEFELTMSGLPGKNQSVSSDIDKNRLHFGYWTEDGQAKSRIDIFHAGQEVGESHEYAVPPPSARAKRVVRHIPYLQGCIAENLIVRYEAPTAKSLTNFETSFRASLLKMPEWRMHGADDEKVLAAFQTPLPRASAGDGEPAAKIRRLLDATAQSRDNARVRPNASTSSSRRSGGKSQAQKRK